MQRVETQGDFAECCLFFEETKKPVINRQTTDQAIVSVEDSSMSNSIVTNQSSTRQGHICTCLTCACSAFPLCSLTRLVTP